MYMLNKSFHDIEYEAWSQRASFYDALFAPVSTQAIDSILDSLGTLTYKHLLDVACGTGHLVTAASQRGAISEGLDFSQPMLDAAQSNYPNERFQLGDAEQLPYDDEAFDVVTCAFGLSHMERPQVAVNEAFRVLRPHGQFAFTLWYGANDGNELHIMVNEAMATHGSPAVTLDNSWTQLRDADEAVCTAVVKQTGFGSPTFRRLLPIFQSTNKQDVIDLVEKLSIRNRLLLDRHSLAAQQNIREYILAAADAHRIDGVISLRMPTLLTVVEKPE
jgi:ubiquinone/menaquinone biosynthesis C-methylase UbiE